MDLLDKRIIEALLGKIVRKDLTALMKRGADVMVGFFLLLRTSSLKQCFLALQSSSDCVGEIRQLMLGANFGL